MQLFSIARLVDPTPNDDLLNEIAEWLKGMFPNFDSCEVSVCEINDKPFRAVAMNHTFKVSVPPSNNKESKEQDLFSVKIFFRCFVPSTDFLTVLSQPLQEKSVVLVFRIQANDTIQTGGVETLARGDLGNENGTRRRIMGAVSEIRAGIDSVWASIEDEIGGIKIKLRKQAAPSEG